MAETTQPTTPTTDLSQPIAVDDGALAVAKDDTFDLASNLSLLEEENATAWTRINTVLTNWSHMRLRMRWLELLTEFGATNLFFIDGDSLVLEFLRESHIAWGLGTPQLLHYVYTIERFLNNLLECGCLFRVVFWKSYRSRYAGLKLNGEDVGAAALLARDVVLTHLKSLSHIDVEDSFDNWWGPEWAAYLEIESPGFVMLSSLRGFDAGQVTDIARAYVLYLYSERISMAEISPIQFTDNRIFTFCLEPYDRRMELKIVPALKSLLQANFAKDSVASDAPLTVSKEYIAGARSWRWIVSTQAAKALFATQPALAKVFLLHTAFLGNTSLRDRSWRVPAFKAGKGVETLRSFLCSVTTHLDSATVALGSANHAVDVTVVDLIDWRMFVLLVKSFSSSKGSLKLADLGLPADVVADLTASWKEASSTALEPLFAADALQAFGDILEAFESVKIDSTHTDEPLPIRSPITDAILTDMVPPLPTRKDYSVQEELGSSNQKFFDDWHWHSGRKITTEESSLADDGTDSYGGNSMQNYVSFIEKFSASLSAKPQWKPRLRSANPASDPIKEMQAELDKETSDPKKNRLAKDEILKLTNQLGHSNNRAVQRRTLERFRPTTKTAQVETDFLLLDRLQAEWVDLLDTWKTKPEEVSENVRLDLAADIMRVILELYAMYQGTTILTVPRKQRMVDVTASLGLSELAASLRSQLQTKAPAASATIPAAAQLNYSSARFQLRCMGPFMERDTSSIKDPRVPFLADEWQVKVLDAIDARNSMLVVAPTSAGKTFISFYAMEQVLKANADDIVVYVAPTKALVNQVAAECYAQFAKVNWLKSRAGVQTFGVFTRDYRFCPTKCRILVTVPECLEILLLSPLHFNSWRKKLKYIIFDEIHSINQDQGSTWERLVAMVPCPFIALSATIGESERFAAWLKSISSHNNIDFKHITHPHRFSDLQKNLLLAKLHKDKKTEIELVYIHPWATFTVRQFVNGIPPDVALSPRDCLELYTAMEAALAGNNSVLSAADAAAFKAVNPDKFFTGSIVITQRHCRSYEKDTKALFKSWTVSYRDLAEKALHILGDGPLSKQKNLALTLEASSVDVYGKPYSSAIMHDLIMYLKGVKMLPAIVFNFERSYCEHLGKLLSDKFEVDERIWRDSPEYLNNVKKYNAAQAAQAQNKKREGKIKSAAEKEALAQEADLLDGGINPAEMLAEHCTLTRIGEVMARSDLDKELEGLSDVVSPSLVKGLIRGVGVHHAGLHKKYLQAVERYFRSGQVKVVFATSTLALGINMPCKTTIFAGDSNFLTPLQFRQMSGRAGRRGFDPIGNVIFLGVTHQKICKLEASPLPVLRGHFPFTTSFLLRSLVLGTGSTTADFKSLYFDVVAPKAAAPAKPAAEEVIDDWEALDEDVVDPEPEPVPLPTGEPELVEKVVKLPAELAAASNTIAGFYTDPLFCLERGYLVSQVQNHVRFSLEFLVRSGFINLHGEPLNLAGIISHLAYTEPSNFVICELLTSNLIHKLCSRPESEWANTARNLIHVMSALFSRVSVPDVLLERVKNNPTRFEPHKIIMPPVADDVKRIFDAHEEHVRNIFTASVLRFVDQNAAKLGADDELPVSKLHLGAENVSAAFDSLLKRTLSSDEYTKARISVKARSAFAALSGLDDVFNSADDLSKTVRKGVFLPAEAMPSLEMRNLAGQLVPLSSYILDMWQWENAVWLQEKNHQRDGDTFANLKDFLLTLKAVATALRRRVPQGQAPDPVATAFTRLAEEFETKFAKLYDTKVRRKFIMIVGGMMGDYRDWRKVPIEKKIRERTRLNPKYCKFGTDYNNPSPNVRFSKVLLKVEMRTLADLQRLEQLANSWMEHDWKIVEIRSRTNTSD